MDYNQPLIQGLLARNYIYMGGQQQVTLDVFTNCIPARFTLQPYVYQTLDHYKPKIDIVNIGLHFFLKNVRPYAASCSEA